MYALSISTILIQKLSLLLIFKKSIFFGSIWLINNIFHDLCEFLMYRIYFYQFVYYCVDCYYLKLMIKSFYKRFRKIQLRNNLKRKSNEQLMKKVMVKLNSICMIITRHNDYWKNYLFSYLSFHIVLNVLFFYIPIFIRENFAIKFFYFAILLTSLCTLLLVFESSIFLSNAINDFHPLFIKSINDKKIKISTKIKVNIIY